jgi:hypothetical protein
MMFMETSRNVVPGEDHARLVKILPRDGRSAESRDIKITIERLDRALLDHVRASGVNEDVLA